MECQQATGQFADGRQDWYAVRVRSNREGVVSLQLRERGYEEFSASYRVERQWSDRKKRLDQFLFPGYVFCRLDPHHRLPVLKVPGVVDLVGSGKVPTPISEQEIERVRTMVRSGLHVMPCPFLEVGDAVLIERGPLAGLEGILHRFKGQFRLVVSIGLLQRSVSAEIDRSWVRQLRRPVLSDQGVSEPSSHTSKLVV
jgi:transcription termination/antitermination protein NusG